MIAVKGAPDVVLDLCYRYQTAEDKSSPLDEAARARILAANDGMTGDALRVLGMAYRMPGMCRTTLPKWTRRNWKRTWSLSGWWG